MSEYFDIIFFVGIIILFRHIPTYDVGIENYMQGDIFHICNRGIEKRRIFDTKGDYIRFIQSLYDFNNTEVSEFSYLNRRKYPNTHSDIRCRNENERGKLVDIICWSLMPNHPHLLVQERIDGGAGKFIRKVSIGYTKYFNIKNKRSGYLFQGRSKIINIKNHSHFLYIPFYIMANALDLFQHNWKENGIKNLKESINFLKNYKYSSFPDLVGKENLPTLINKEIFYNLFDTSNKRFKEDFSEWLVQFSNKKNENFKLVNDFEF